MREATDFSAENKVLEALLAPLSQRDFAIETQFKRWSINDVLQHIHILNLAALLSLTDPNHFRAYAAAMLADTRGLRAFEHDWLDGLSGRALFDVWRETANETVTQFGGADPKARLTWFGPDMSARSCITARQMETWAHGQEVFDILGADREESDRIRNIAHLGVSTFGWTHVNRGRDAPAQAPLVRLRAPSGATWEWNEAGAERVEGSAVEFCRVVTQTRSLDDTELRVAGENARWWMRHAQCFAGRPQDPPPPGARFKQRRGDP
jgi:uncharacterized protein (TIGR03084 family)